MFKVETRCEGYKWNLSWLASEKVWHFGQCAYSAVYSYARRTTPFSHLNGKYEEITSLSNHNSAELLLLHPPPKKAKSPTLFSLNIPFISLRYSLLFAPFSPPCSLAYTQLTSIPHIQYTHSNYMHKMCSILCDYSPVSAGRGLQLESQRRGDKVWTKCFNSHMWMQ